MFQIRIVSVLIFSLTLIFYSCTPKHSEIVVAEYGKSKVSLGEFENVYAKNAGGVETAKKDSIERLRNFLDLYVNFKMKLRDAEVRGYKSNPVLDAELKDYKEKVGVSYLIEKEIIDPGITELYERRKYELRVSHLMIRPDSLGDEKAKELTLSLIDRINKGENFENLVKQYSDDLYSKNDGGDIYYVTAGMVIPEFEDAAYKTELGKIYPEPVKTRYGYHIIKVTDKKVRTPQVKASHLVLDFKVDSVKVDTSAVLAQIKDLKKQLDNGADFAELAKKYSEDPGSKNNGGDLGLVERRMMVKEFDEALFNLEEGQISDIVKTRFGYHIIKVNEKIHLPSFENEKENLKKLFKKSGYDQAYADYIKKLKQNYNFKLNESTIDYIVKNNDSTKVGDKYWQSSWRAGIKDTDIYYLNNQAVSVDSFFARIEKMPEYSSKLIDKKLLTTAVDKDVENKVLVLKVFDLDGQDVQFTSLMEEYRNGIYIFKLQEEEVWNKIKIDSIKLYNFYTEKVKLLQDDSNANDPEIKELKEKLYWKDRVNFAEIFSRKDSLINDCYNQIEKGIDFKGLAAIKTERAGYKEKGGEYGLVDVNSNELAQKANGLQKPGDFTKPFKHTNGFSIVKLIAKEPARLKTFDEARAEISSLYQEAEAKRLENEYVTSLKQLYKPVIYYNKVEEAFKSN